MGFKVMQGLRVARANRHGNLFLEGFTLMNFSHKKGGRCGNKLFGRHPFPSSAFTNANSVPEVTYCVSGLPRPSNCTIREIRLKALKIRQKPRTREDTSTVIHFQVSLLTLLRKLIRNELGNQTMDKGSHVRDMTNVYNERGSP